MAGGLGGLAGLEGLEGLALGLEEAGGWVAFRDLERAFNLFRLDLLTERLKGVSVRDNLMLTHGNPLASILLQLAGQGFLGLDFPI